MTPPAPWSPPPSPLIDHLTGLLRPQPGKRPGRGEVQALRRAARTPHHVDLHAAGTVYPFVGRTRVAQDAGMLTALMWATWHTGYDRAVNADGTNIGGALRRLPADRAQRLFLELGTATEPTLPKVLHHTITALAGAGAAVDWRQTHHDLRQWMRGESQPVLRRWATSLYAPNPTDTEIEGQDQ